MNIPKYSPDKRQTSSPFFGTGVLAVKWLGMSSERSAANDEYKIHITIFTIITTQNKLIILSTQSNKQSSTVHAVKTEINIEQRPPI